MILNKLQKTPEKMVPVAMALVVIGLSLLTIGIAWPRISTPPPHAGTDWNDFFRGAIFGIAIVLEVVGVVLATKAAALKKHNSL
jgi:hypothetical protein